MHGTVSGKCSVANIIGSSLHQNRIQCSTSCSSSGVTASRSCIVLTSFRIWSAQANSARGVYVCIIVFSNWQLLEGVACRCSSSGYYFYNELFSGFSIVVVLT